MIVFTQDDRQMMTHTADVIGDRMRHEDGYTEQDEATVAKLDELSKALTTVLVITGDEPTGGVDDPQVREMFRDIVRAELAHPVPGASQRLLYRAALVLGIRQPDPAKGQRDCGADVGDHALISDWVVGLYLHRCSNCFRLFEL